MSSATSAIAGATYSSLIPFISRQTFASLLCRIRSQTPKVLFAYLLYILYKYRSTAITVTNPRFDLPGPKGLPLLGNTLFMLNRAKGKNYQIQTQLHEEFGKIYAVTVLGFPRVINVRDPGMIDHVLRTSFWKYEKGELFRTVYGPLIGGGIFGADGEHWRWQRKLASHIFNVGALREYTSDVFCQQSQLVLDYFTKITATEGSPGQRDDAGYASGTDSASDNEKGEQLVQDLGNRCKMDQGVAVVDLQNIFQLFTLDTFGEIAFGQTFGCMKDPTHSVKFAASFDRMNVSLTRRFSTPFWKFSEWWTGQDKQIEYDTRVIHDFAYDLIRKRRRDSEREQEEWSGSLETDADDEDEFLGERKRTMSGTGIGDGVAARAGYGAEMRSGRIRTRKRTRTNDGQKKDLLQLFMDAKDDKGKQLSDEALKDTLLNFVLAGRDTTSQALSWMFYLILRSGSRRDILEKLIAETDQVFNNPNSRKAGMQSGMHSNTGPSVHKGNIHHPTYERIKTQKYAEACFYESLRLYPSIPHNIKVCAEDDILPGGTKVYKGEMIAWGSWAMGRDKTIWGEDAEEFRPERWLQGDKISQAKFVSFHLGPRACIGQHFATIEAITITSMMIQNFTFELLDPHKEPTYQQAITLPMAEGLSVRVKRRYFKTDADRVVNHEQKQHTGL